MLNSEFTIRILRNNPHSEKTFIWKAGQIVTGMEGCRIDNIVKALSALELDTGDTGRGDPARWLSHFAGLESADSGKAMEPWIEIIHKGLPVKNTASYRELMNTIST